jgi:hypothetical protein
MSSNIKIAVAILVSAATGFLVSNASGKPRVKPLISNPPSVEERRGFQVIDPLVAGTWTLLTNGFPGNTSDSNFGPGTALLLTDGSVVMHNNCTPNWYRLIPDLFGNYPTGTWSAFALGDNSPLAPMIGSGTAPDGYGPLFFASAVLPDGRLIVQGGEYDGSVVANCGNLPNGNPPESTKGSLYNPQTNTWSAVPAPNGWTAIGDSNSMVLGPNNLTGVYSAFSYMLGNNLSSQQAVATIAPIPGTAVTWTATGTGKADANSEEGWIWLPNGELVTVDTQNGTNTEIFNPATGAWTTAGNTPAFLGKAPAPCCVPEMGPGLGTGFGIAVQFGANNLTAVFTLALPHWTAGPSFASTQEILDGPAALLPNGSILVQTSIAQEGGPDLFWEFGGATVQNPGGLTSIPVPNPTCAPSTNLGTNNSRMVVLPSGQILWDAGQGGLNCTSIYLPNPGDGSPSQLQAPAPGIATISNTNLFRGNTYTLTGSLFKGVSQGAMFGNDAQSASNYPMVQITNTGSGHVCWGRTHDSAITTSTQFNVPPSVTPTPGWALYENPCDPGPSTLVVITNGLRSNGIAVTIL